MYSSIIHELLHCCVLKDVPIKSTWKYELKELENLYKETSLMLMHILLCSVVIYFE